MAEYKTYTCDIKGCGKQDAQRFTFPCVDQMPRQIAEQTAYELQVEGHVDLCQKHIPRIFDFLLKKLNGMEAQREAWKAILGK